MIDVKNCPFLLKLKNIICKIPDSVFNAGSIVFALLFMINPLLMLINSRYIPDFPVFTRNFNKVTFAAGSVLLLLFALRYILRNKKTDLRSFIKNDLKALAKEHIPIVLFLGFALAMIISTRCNGWVYFMLHGNDNRGEGLIAYLGYVTYFLLMIVNNSDLMKKIWMYIFIASSAVLEIVTIYEFYAKHYYDNTFVFKQFNHYAYYIMMSGAVSAVLVLTAEKKWQKVLFAVTMFTSVLTLVINDTFGCSLATLAGLIFICIIFSLSKSGFRFRYLVPVAVFFAAYGTGILTSEELRLRTICNFDGSNYNIMVYYGRTSDGEPFNIEGTTERITDDQEERYFGGSAENVTTVSNRTILWKYGLSYVLEEPVTGHGPDMTSGRLFSDSNFENERCACEYLNYAISFGIPAAALYIWAIVRVYFRGLKYRKKLTATQLTGLGAAMFYLISAVVGNSMYYTSPFMFILLGMGYYRQSKDTSD